MDKYELNKNPQQKENPEEVVESKRKNPNVEPMEVEFRFSTSTAQWYIWIRRLGLKDEKSRDWELVYHQVNNRSEILYFDAVDEAQEWCEQKGLL